MKKDFWNKKKVFITGNTGFKGGWLVMWLSSLGAELKGFSLPPKGDPSLYDVAKIGRCVKTIFGDIRDLDKLRTEMVRFDPDIVIHLAAQPLVRASYSAPLETYSTNVMGTVNVLEAARSCNRLKAILNVTTDKCYENHEKNRSFREIDPLGGRDPYSSSKACSEIITSAYYKSFFEVGSVGVATARAGNVIGGGDWSEDRLIADVFRSMLDKKPLIIRNPNAIRPWQHVLESVNGYTILLEALYNDPVRYSKGWNFGPGEGSEKSVEWILKFLSSKLDDLNWQYETKKQPYEAQTLNLDITNALEQLDWSPIWDLESALVSIVDWIATYQTGGDLMQMSFKQIEAYREELYRHGKI